MTHDSTIFPVLDATAYHVEGKEETNPSKFVRYQTDALDFTRTVLSKLEQVKCAEYLCTVLIPQNIRHVPAVLDTLVYENPETSSQVLSASQLGE